MPTPNFGSAASKLWIYVAFGPAGKSASESRYLCLPQGAICGRLRSSVASYSYAAIDCPDGSPITFRQTVFFSEDFSGSLTSCSAGFERIDAGKYCFQKALFVVRALCVGRQIPVTSPFHFPPSSFLVILLNPRQSCGLIFFTNDLAPAFNFVTRSRNIGSRPKGSNFFPLSTERQISPSRPPGPLPAS